MNAKIINKNNIFCGKTGEVTNKKDYPFTKFGRDVVKVQMINDHNKVINLELFVHEVVIL